MVKMDRILFGDNQFFGVNHMSEEKSRQQLMKFRDAKAIIDVLDVAYDMGVRTFMCTTHDRIGEICDHMRADPVRYKDFIYYPCMPYAHKYANAVSEVGILEAIRRFCARGVVSTLFRGTMGALTHDVYKLMKILIDAEMKRFAGLNTPVIFIQNVVTDLVLGMKVYDVFGEFHRYVRERYGAEAAYITMNLPALLDGLERAGVENPIVCSSINKINFRMSGGLAAYERTLRERYFRPVAMSVFASGAIPADEALEYVCSQTKIESIVFGASSRGNIRNTKELIERFDRKYAAAVS